MQSGSTYGIIASGVTMLMHKYTINIYWNDTNECYKAYVPEFDDVTATGATYQEAFDAIRSALDKKIDELKNEGLTLPQAVTLSGYSGQLRLRMPKSLHQELTQEAEKEGISLNAYMVYLLSTKHMVHKGKTEIDHHLKGFVIHPTGTAPAALKITQASIRSIATLSAGFFKHSPEPDPIGLLFCSIRELLYLQAGKPVIRPLIKRKTSRPARALKV